MTLAADFADIKAVLDQVAYGGDYASLATKLGTTQTEAEAVYNLWGSANAEIHGLFLAQLAARTG